ncbi:MAG: hypothetical protein JWO38_4957 [Gemmataceae bacterium]|nr:hypothetical protein [Gemmataceae bacterium]
MARLRYSRTEAQAEAQRRAEAFVADRPDRDQWRLRGTSPNTLVPPSRASKHPVAWVAVFAPVPPDGGVIDGGELFVAVDLETGGVGVLGF